ncbi:putative gastrointestinal growth factor xP1 [Pleurodeles waltl]|uniref:putative gastrointestinal growth factor xP1 n=1 Tax=Pleurodeles waltl TaxID=8319 RepID=UPI0037098A30
MAHKMFHVLALALIIGVIMTNVQADEECNVEPKKRIQCGSSQDISEEDCLSIKCCYDKNVPDAISCFKNIDTFFGSRRTTIRRRTTRRRRPG